VERCQIFYRTPCLIVAIDGQLLEPPPGGSLPRRDMPRVSGAAPSTWPASRPSRRAARAEAGLRGYGAAPGAKAIALHPHGRASRDRRRHSTRPRAALRACNQDPQRGGRDGLPALRPATSGAAAVAHHAGGAASRGRPPSRRPRPARR
jgi:hypothetical protein